jgi:hypothetical protein
MIEEISSARAGTVLARPREMPDDQYNGIEIEVNVYERAGQWTGEYILTKRLEAYTLNEVNFLSEARDTKRRHGSWHCARRDAPSIGLRERLPF